MSKAKEHIDKNPFKYYTAGMFTVLFPLIFAANLGMPVELRFALASEAQERECRLAILEEESTQMVIINLEIKLASAPQDKTFLRLKRAQEARLLQAQRKIIKNC